MSDIYDHFPAIIDTAKLPVVVFEIGVGKGEDMARMVHWIAGQVRSYRYFAFEPEIKNLPAILAAVGKTQAVIVSAAVGDVDGKCSFTSSGSWPLSGSVKEPKEHRKSYPWIPWQAPVDVPMVRLDTFARSEGVEKVDFIWADVQGAEDLLIAGGQETLRRTRYFYTEHYETLEYEGQIGLEEIHRRLPGRWKIVATWAGDVAITPGSGNVLFENLDFPQ